MKMKTVVCTFILIVLATYQSVNAKKEFGGTLTNKQFVESLLDATSVTERKNVLDVSLQAKGKAKGPNPKDPGLKKTKVLYRVIRSDESCENGLLAKDPEAKHTIASHVVHGSKKKKGSQYISFTTSLEIAEHKYAKQGGTIVKVNVGDLPPSCELTDLNDCFTREKVLGHNIRAFNFARKDCEVVLACKKPIPCSSFKVVVPNSMVPSKPKSIVPYKPIKSIVPYKPNSIVSYGKFLKIFRKPPG